MFGMLGMLSMLAMFFMLGRYFLTLIVACGWRCRRVAHACRGACLPLPPEERDGGARGGGWQAGMVRSRAVQ